EAGRSDDFRRRHAALLAWRIDRRTDGADRGALAAIGDAAAGWRRRFGVRKVDASEQHPPHPSPPLQGGGLLARARPQITPGDQPGGHEPDHGAARRALASRRNDVASSTAIGDVLVHAFPDRIARQDPDNPRRYTLSNGRGARLHEGTGLFGEPWL